MKALLIGAGGIGQNVYLPQLIKKGFTVDTVDSNLPATFDNVDKVDRKYEVAIICTPNFTHFEIATYIAKKNIAPVVFVENPDDSGRVLKDYNITNDQKQQYKLECRLRGGCLIKGTKVLLSNDQQIPIEDINIGDYVSFSEVYKGEKGDLDIDNYVLSYNLDKAKKHFTQVPMMIEAFEYWFGPYPFYEDSFKIVEVPYLGMEHQSSITYGNGYQNGYKGSSYPSNSKWGLEFDYIIIHEGGHEWFANNITYIDIADMWLHEGFTTYSENLYVEYYFGKEAGSDYVISSRSGISNRKPMITGEYGINRESSGDIYAKGANVLHTLRQIVDNDELWRQTLRGINKDFYHQTVSSEQIENYISNTLNINLDKFFHQYLRDIRIPILEYEIIKGELFYRWNNVIDGFDMPVEVIIDGENKVLNPTTEFKSIPIKNLYINVDNDYYVYTKDLKIIIDS